MARFVFVLCLLLSTVLLPPAVTALLTVFGVLCFPRFWEAVLVGLFLDALYGASVPYLLGFQFIYTLALCVALLALERWKKSVRAYRENLVV